jgi:hypothetical protein
VERLREICAELDQGMRKHYIYWVERNEKTGKDRHYRTPKPELKPLQRRIKSVILDPIKVSESAHGGVRNRSTHSNARAHIGHKFVVTMDVKSFFPSVRHYVVYRLFRHELGFGTEVAAVLTRLTTLHAQLPQGAPTSTSIANLLLSRAVDAQVSEAARGLGATNTRYVDDFCFSGDDPKPLINEAARALSLRRLPVWRKSTKFQAKPKLKIMPRSRRQEVTGLTVNAQSGPSVPREYRDRVRAAIHRAAEISDASERKGADRSIRGRILYVAQTNLGAAKRLSRCAARSSGVSTARPFPA